jgi:hypothetical protein
MADVVEIQSITANKDYLCFNASKIGEGVYKPKKYCMDRSNNVFRPGPIENFNNPTNSTLLGIKLPPLYPYDNYDSLKDFIGKGNFFEQPITLPSSNASSPKVIKTDNTRYGITNEPSNLNILIFIGDKGVTRKATIVPMAQENCNRDVYAKSLSIFDHERDDIACVGTIKLE